MMPPADIQAAVTGFSDASRKLGMAKGFPEGGQAFALGAMQAMLISALWDLPDDARAKQVAMLIHLAAKDLAEAADLHNRKAA